MQKSISRMYSIQIHRVISQLLSVFYRVGYWYRGEQPTTSELRAKILYCLYYSLLFTALGVGAITAELSDESIFLCECILVVLVLEMKFCILIWKHKQISELLHRVGVFSIRNADDVTFFNDKLERFMKFIVTFLWISLFAFVFAIAVPLFSSERKMIVDFAFPLDWRKGGTAYWMAYAFMATEIVFTFSAELFTIVLWYLMFLCSLRYKVIGSEIENTGRSDERNGGKLTEKESHKLFRKDLESSIVAHCHLRGLIDELVSFASKLFVLQFATSATCICASVYCLAFDIGENLLERIIHLYSLFFHISELFVITYFGNEIMLSSDKLSYKLFESNWVDQPQSTKKIVIIFGEYLRQPHELMVFKLYPLNLQTFNRILNSAYSFFNILKNTKQ